MRARERRRALAYGAALGALAFGGGCLPRSDLQAYGRGGANGEDAAIRDGSMEPDVTGTLDGRDPGEPDDEETPDAGRSPEAGASEDPANDAGPESDKSVGVADAGDAAPGAEDPPADPGDAGAAQPTSPRVLGPLPNDLIDAPVAGEITFSRDAAWEVDAVFQPTFEIHTPSASYWIVKPLGTIVSLEDHAPEGQANDKQWIAFSSGFRPLRGVPAFPSTPASPVNTTLDEDSQTPTHLRLNVESADSQWRWTWDFYVTHVTLTVERAPVALGFGYRGVPAGNLGPEDTLNQADGTTQEARNSFADDLPGPFEWAYLADADLRRSLYLIQHDDDDLPEKYQVRDNDSAHFLFGGGQITDLPMRFSLGMIDSVEREAVRERVEYVHRMMR